MKSLNIDGCVMRKREIRYLEDRDHLAERDFENYRRKYLVADMIMDYESLKADSSSKVKKLIDTIPELGDFVFVDKKYKKSPLLLAVLKKVIPNSRFSFFKIPDNQKDYVYSCIFRDLFNKSSSDITKKEVLNYLFKKNNFKSRVFIDLFYSSQIKSKSGSRVASLF
jgi:hypothetical protein